MPSQSYSKVLPLCVGVFVLSVVIGYTILAWTEPAQAPPNGNVAAPINTSAYPQTKIGDFTIGNTGWTQIKFYPSLNDVYNPLTGASDTAHFHFGFPSTPAGKKPLLEIPADLWIIGGGDNLVVDGTTKTSRICLGSQCCSTWAECIVLGGCTPESNSAFCTRLGKNCGSVTAPDNCGTSRTVNCGSCTSPATCGGGGVANVCGTSCTANGGTCSTYAPKVADSSCCSGNCSYTTCCGSTECGWGAGVCVANGGTQSNQWLDGICRSGYWKTRLNGYGCASGTFPCDSGTCDTNQNNGLGGNGKCVVAASTPCPSTPIPSGSKHIFVTSGLFRGDSMPNDSAADTICQNAAKTAGWGNYQNYHALVYLGSRMPHNVLTSGKTYYTASISGTSCTWNTVGLAQAGMFSQDLSNPIQYNEYGQSQPGVYVRTNFVPKGGGAYDVISLGFYNINGPSWYWTCPLECVCPAAVCGTITNGCVVGAYYTPGAACSGNCVATNIRGSTSSKDVNWAAAIVYETPIAYTSCYATITALYCAEQ